MSARGSRAVCSGRVWHVCWHGLVPEGQLQLLTGAFVREIIVAVGAQRHRLDVGTRPDDMDVLAAFLFMQHDGAGLAVEAQLAL